MCALPAHARTTGEGATVPRPFAKPPRLPLFITVFRVVKPALTADNGSSLAKSIGCSLVAARFSSRGTAPLNMYARLKTARDAEAVVAGLAAAPDVAGFGLRGVGAGAIAATAVPSCCNSLISALVSLFLRVLRVGLIKALSFDSRCALPSHRKAAPPDHVRLDRLVH